jgi:hypothetical protein
MQLFIQVTDSIDDITTQFANLRERVAGEQAIANYQIAWAKTQQVAFQTAAIALITFSYICLAIGFTYKLGQTVAAFYQRVKPHAIVFAQAIATEFRQAPPTTPQLAPVAEPIIAKASAKQRQSTARVA